MALPGARFELDKASNRYKIAQIFQGRTRRRSTARRSPRSASTSKVGDYVLAINGQELTGKDDPYRLLRNAADKPVR